MRNCKQCQSVFEINDHDPAFYEKMKISEPALCRDCRSQRRMSWRNEKMLYRRSCGLCAGNIISIYSPDKPFPVYCQDCFWADQWDPLIYGMDFDFNRPFFGQFEELQKKVPRLAVVNKQSQNSDYCNYSFANKNCYLTFGNHYEEDCLYGRYSTKNRDCLDYLMTYNSELCYENILSKNCHRSVYLDRCESSDECWFSSNLTGCKNCLFSSNLNHKEYYILNKPYTKEAYFEKIKSYKLDTYEGLKRAKDFFETYFPTLFPVHSSYKINCENVFGENLNQCRNVQDSFDCDTCEDIAHAEQIDQTFDSMDMTCMGYDKSELCYETIGCSGLFNCVSCDSCWHDSDLFYCNLCFSSKNCFGSVSLQHKTYCILNKQYSKEDYEALLPLIIDHMKKGQEWGEFFPASISPFAYNETIAQEYFPLDLSQTQKRGWKWKEIEDKVTEVTKKIPAKKLPETIAEIPDDVLNWAIECEDTGRPFKIQKKELEFYRKMNLPLPHFHPDVRLAFRMKRRLPRKLWERECTKCHSVIQASYSTERPETVYCESCYLKEVC